MSNTSDTTNPAIIQDPTDHDQVIQCHDFFFRFQINRTLIQIFKLTDF